MLKKALSLVLSLLICFGAMAVMPVAASAEEVDSFDAVDARNTIVDTAVTKENSPSISSDADLADTGASADIAEEGVQYGGWSSWSSTPAYASSTRQVETRRVIVSYDIEGNCCGNSQGYRCYLKYMQSGYTLRLHYPRLTVAASELNRWETWSEGSYYTYASNVNGYIIGPGTGYINPDSHTPYFIIGTNYETQYRYRDRVYTPISRCSISLSQTSYTYDGNPKTPTVTVKNGSTVLRKGYDYTVSYKNNVNVGTASVIITGIDNYNGSVTKTFTIKKASGYALAAPVITKLKSTTAGVSVTWGKVPGAAKYRVYLKTSAGWKKLCDTASLSYIYTKVSSGTKYYFSVRCLSADASKFTSDMNTTGWAITYFATPKIKTLTNASIGVKITWGKVNKASKYRVFLITSGGLKKLGDSTSTTFTHKAAKSGTKYTYTVCCITKDGSKAVSAYNTKGWAITFIAMPQFKSISYSASGHVLKWKKIAGAPMYCVLIKSGGKWKALAYTTGTSYTYKKAKVGVKYTYSLRCVNKQKKPVSAYDAKGKVFRSLTAPKMQTFSKESNGFFLAWKAVSGAKLYRIEYRTRATTGKSSWSAWKTYSIFDGSNRTIFYTYHSQGGLYYQYRIRCVNSAGSALGPITYTKAVRFAVTPYLSNYRYLICPNAPDYIEFIWSYSQGAYKYLFYRKYNGKWYQIGSTYGNSFKFYGSPKNTYDFGIRAVDSSGKALSKMRVIHTYYSNYSGLNYSTSTEN